MSDIPYFPCPASLRLEALAVFWKDHCLVLILPSWVYLGSASEETFVFHQNKVNPASRSRVPQCDHLALGWLQQLSEKAYLGSSIPGSFYVVVWGCSCRMVSFSFLPLLFQSLFLFWIKYHLCAGAHSLLLPECSFCNNKSWWLLIVLLSWLAVSITCRHHGDGSLRTVHPKAPWHLRHGRRRN